MEKDKRISWRAPEYIRTEKNANWYVALGIAAVASAAAAFLLDNMLFSVLIIIGALTLALYSARAPGTIEAEISKRGVTVNNHLYPHETLDSFWVEEDEDEPKILIKSEKTLLPYIVIPLGDTDPDEVRDFLLEYIDEEEHHEPLMQKFMEYLGF